METNPTTAERAALLRTKGWAFSRSDNNLGKWRADHDSGMGAIYAPTLGELIDQVWALTREAS